MVRLAVPARAYKCAAAFRLLHGHSGFRCLLRNAEKRRKAVAVDLRLDTREHAQHRTKAWFSSDRAIGEYAQKIWKAPLELPSNLLGREQEQGRCRLLACLAFS